MSKLNVEVNNKKPHVISGWFAQLFICVAILSVSGIAKADWPVQFGDATSTNKTDAVIDTTVDSSGNTLVLGRFAGKVNFTKTDGTLKTLNGLAGRDIYIAKYDSSGDFIWAQKATSSGSMDGYRIEVDAADNAFVVGYSYREINLSSITISFGSFLAKLDTNGNWLWAKGGISSYAVNGSYARQIALSVTESGVYVSYDRFLEGFYTPEFHLKKYSLTGLLLANQVVSITDGTNPLWSAPGGISVINKSETSVEVFLSVQFSDSASPSVCANALTAGTTGSLLKLTETIDTTTNPATSSFVCDWAVPLDTGGNGRDIGEIVNDGFNIYHARNGRIKAFTASTGTDIWTDDFAFGYGVEDQLGINDTNNVFFGSRTALAVDKDKNLYLSGKYQGSPTFKGTPGATTPDKTLPQAEQLSPYIAKFITAEKKWAWVSTATHPAYYPLMNEYSMRTRIALGPDDSTVNVVGGFIGIMDNNVTVSDNGQYVGGMGQDENRIEKPLSSSPLPADGGLLFDGSDDYINLPGDVLSGNTSYSVSFKVRVEPSAALDGIWSVFSAAKAGSDNELLYYFNGSNSTFTIWEKSRTVAAFPGVSINDGLWHTVAVGREIVDTNINYYLFIDDLDKQTITIACGADCDSLTYTPDIPSGGLMIGQDQDCFGGCISFAQALDGRLDDFAFWSTAIGSGTTTTNPWFGQTLTGSEANLLAYWNFNKPFTSGDKLQEVSPNGYDVLLTDIPDAARPQRVPGANSSNISAFGGNADAYAVTLDPYSGQWLIPQIITASQTIQAPNSLGIRPSINVYGVGDNTVDAWTYFYWNVSEQALYALRPMPGLATISWPTTSDSANPKPSTMVVDIIDTPEDQRQFHIADTAADLEPAAGITNIDTADNSTLPFLKFLRIEYSTVLDLDNSITSIFSRGSVLPGDDDYVIVHYLKVASIDTPADETTQASFFQYVYTREWDHPDVFADNQTCLIGQPVTDAEHVSVNGLNGKVMRPRATIDANGVNAAHNIQSQTGPIISVNTDTTPDDDTDDVVVAWSRQNIMNQVWADKSLRYDCQWPASPASIVIADQKGSGDLPATYLTPEIYNQPDSTLPGFNPNEEHALMSSGRAYALRNDLNKLMQYSDPYVLLKYQDAYNNNQWTFKVYSVADISTAQSFAPVLDDPANQLYKLEAGLLIQPPAPLATMPKCNAADQTVITDADSTKPVIWHDHKNYPYAKASGNFKAKYFYPLQYGFYYAPDPTAQPGTCVPWLDQLSGGTTGTPVEIDYAVHWPVATPIVSPGETVFSSKEVMCAAGPDTGINQFPSVYSVAIDPQSPNALYTIHPGNSSFSLYAGNENSLSSIAALQATGGFVDELVVDPFNSSTLFVSFYGSGVTVASAVYKSIDGGVNWVKKSTGVTSDNILALTMDPVTANTLYAGGESSDGSGGYNGGVFKSTDGGDAWTAMNTGLGNLRVRSIAVNPSTNSILYAGTDGGGVFKSIDGGANWSAANTGLGSLRVTSIAIDPATPATLYAATRAGAYKSTDSGTNWSSMAVVEGVIVTDMVIDQSTPTTVYAGISTGSVFKSLDSGATWTEYTAGLPVDQNINDLSIDPLTPTTLYAGTAKGIYKSLDAGETWQAFNNWLATLNGESCFLPDIYGQIAATIIYDATDPTGADPANSSVKIIDPLSPRSATLLTLDGSIATFLSPADGKKYFTDLPFHLRTRLSYDEANQTLSFKGWWDNSQTGDVHLLPNIMTARERNRILEIESDTTDFATAVNALYDLSRNPNGLNAGGYQVGLQPSDDLDPLNPDAEHQALLGPNMALTAGRPKGTGYITLAFGDDNSSPKVTLQVLKLADEPNSCNVYRGNLWEVPSDNIFEEALTLRHTGDFAGDPDNIYFEWFYQPDTDGQPNFAVDAPPPASPWIVHAGLSGLGAVDLTIEGPGILTLSDNWFVMRYGGQGTGTGLGGSTGTNVCDNDNTASAWVGAPGDGPTRAMLATGWIKRVVAGLNPFDQRVNEFHSSGVNTLSSMIAQAGAPYSGPIPFNPDPDVVNSVGLIEAYQTVLETGQDLSINAGFNNAAANNQLLNVATRIADMYTMLGNEAYADAQDPTIGFGTGSELGSLASSIFTFQNQVSSPLEEELALLRGRDGSHSTISTYPVYNRLFWNFTQGEGEVAYAQSYNIIDQNKDGFINEIDASLLFPQAHGDAWGHYLSSVKLRYKLLQEPNFTWIPRSESVLVGGSPIEVDYLDERKFAQAAAAKTRAGVEVMNLTYREKYIEAPAGQWQGYKDTDADRAWGLDGWARRAGQGAYLDWVTTNAIVPAVDPNPAHTGISKVDRTTVVEIGLIASGLQDIQSQMDKADAGLNPIGLAKNVVPFDIDPNFLEVSSVNQGQTHFDQIALRAQKALDNAIDVFNHASQQTQSLRQVQDDVNQLENLVLQQEQDYKYRLIEIYGYPYAGDVGAGKTYPSDYNGPDIFHYMYVDSTATGELKFPDNEIHGYYSPENFGDQSGFVFPGDTSDPAYVDGGVNSSLVNTPFADTTLDVVYPVASDETWGFVAPQNWQQRRAPGEIQMAVSELLQAESQLKHVIRERSNLLAEIQDVADLIDAEYRLYDKTLEILEGNETRIIELNTELQYFKKKENKALRAGVIARDLAAAISSGIPETWDGLGSIARGIALGVGFTAANIAEVHADEAELSGYEAEQKFDAQAASIELKLHRDTPNVALIERVKELEQIWRREALMRMEIFKQIEVVKQSGGRVSSVIAKGQRLMEERFTYRVLTAGDTQQYRYRDMTFRIFRNDALQKYRATFDLAARYIYLAAVAYDYETNLLCSDPSAGCSFLEDIVRQRSLGQVIDGVPVAGTPGLADVLARLQQNFDVYRGQLGFNNPQIETNRFSLRYELFRKFTFQDPDDISVTLKDLALNDDWRRVLRSFHKPNLWNIPEFRRYMRPFTTEDQGEQPGLVIPFSTEVNFGRNFFGHELGGGDSAYDPSNFATKIRGVGTWFSNYNGAALSNTPRIYLVPVGMDVLRSPSDDTLATREWRVVDQKLPAPFPIGADDLANPDWIPANDSLGGTYGDIRRHSSFRAYHDSGAYDPAEIVTDSRLIGRSVWNTQWLLVIPGGTLLYGAEEGLNRLIDGQLIPDDPNGDRDGNGISDILLNFQTYGYSGN